MPVLKELNPQLEWSFLETARQVSAAENLLQQLVNKLKQEILEEREGYYYLHLPPLLHRSEPQYLLAAMLEPFGLSWQLAGTILQSLQKIEGTISGRWFTTPTHRIVIDRQQLVISTLPLSNKGPVYLSCRDESISLKRSSSR